MLLFRSFRIPPFKPDQLNIWLFLSVHNGTAARLFTFLAFLRSSKEKNVKNELDHLKKNLLKSLKLYRYRIFCHKGQIWIRYNCSGSGYHLAEKSRIRPDPDPQHCKKHQPSLYSMLPNRNNGSSQGSEVNFGNMCQIYLGICFEVKYCM
jgi:hypothetical protein